MRPLRAVVNDVARAMRRRAIRLIASAAPQHDHAACERAMAQALIRYAELIEAATRRPPTRRKKVRKAK